MRFRTAGKKNAFGRPHGFDCPKAFLPASVMNLQFHGRGDIFPVIFQTYYIRAGRFFRPLNSLNSTTCWSAFLSLAMTSPASAAMESTTAKSAAVTCGSHTPAAKSAATAKGSHAAAPKSAATTKRLRAFATRYRAAAAKSSAARDRRTGGGSIAEIGRTHAPALLKSRLNGSYGRSRLHAAQTGVSDSTGSAHYPPADSVIPTCGPDLISSDMVAVDIDGSVDIDMDVTMAPVTKSPSGTPEWPDRDACRKPERPCADKTCPAVIGVKNIVGVVGTISVGRVCRIPPGSIDYIGIICRNIDQLRIYRRDLDIVSTDNHPLLLGAPQVALSIGPVTQALDRIQDIGLLSHKSIPHLTGPLHFVAHHGKNLRKGNQRLHTEIPVFAVQCGIQFFTLEICIQPHPLIRFDHLFGVGRCYQDLPDQ